MSVTGDPGPIKGGTDLDSTGRPCRRSPLRVGSSLRINSSFVSVNPDTACGPCPRAVGTEATPTSTPYLACRRARLLQSPGRLGTDTSARDRTFAESSQAKMRTRSMAAEFAVSRTRDSQATRCACCARGVNGASVLDFRSGLRLMMLSIGHLFAVHCCSGGPSPRERGSLRHPCRRSGPDSKGPSPRKRGQAICLTGPRVSFALDACRRFSRGTNVRYLGCSRWPRTRIGIHLRMPGEASSVGEKLRESVPKGPSPR